MFARLDLEAPASVNVLSSTSTTIELSWSAVENADEYRVLVFKADQFAANQVNQQDYKRTVSFAVPEGQVEG